MGRLSDRTVIVTGGAQGIGASYARAIAAEGGNVVVCDVVDTAPIVAELGARAWGTQCDVTDSAAVDAMAPEGSSGSAGSTGW